MHQSCHIVGTFGTPLWHMVLTVGDYLSFSGWTVSLEIPQSDVDSGLRDQVRHQNRWFYFGSLPFKTLLSEMWYRHSLFHRSQPIVGPRISPKCLRISTCEIKLERLFDGEEGWGTSGHWCSKPNDPWHFLMILSHFLGLGSWSPPGRCIGSQILGQWGYRCCVVWLYLEDTISRNDFSFVHDKGLAQPFMKQFPGFFWVFFVFFLQESVSLP